MLAYWGERCSAYHEECVCCQAWEQYDGKTSAQRTWVDLTDEDNIDWEEGGNLKDLVKAIEAKLKEKNNG
jgi:hypothetical protein